MENRISSSLMNSFTHVVFNSSGLSLATFLVCKVTYKKACLLSVLMRLYITVVTKNYNLTTFLPSVASWLPNKKVNFNPCKGQTNKFWTLLKPTHRVLGLITVNKALEMPQKANTKILLLFATKQRWSFLIGNKIFTCIYHHYKQQFDSVVHSRSNLIGVTSLTHSLACSLTCHSLTSSIPPSVSQSVSHLVTQSLIQSVSHSLTHSLTHPLTRS